MDASSLVRLRWRLRGAWMWPLFVVLAVADGFLIHWHPLTGDSTSAVGGVLFAVFVTLIATIALAPLFGRLIRVVRGDMPRVVARNYGGAIICLLITAVIFAVGLVHHGVIAADRNALADATARAEAYIGDHAPAPFRRNLKDVDTLEIQPPRIYRSCVHNALQTRTYCVIVDRNKPYAHSVRFSGHESNSLLSQGTS